MSDFCKLCKCDLIGRWRFMSYTPLGEARGPFCAKCMDTPVLQVKCLEDPEFKKKSLRECVNYKPGWLE